MGYLKVTNKLKGTNDIFGFLIILLFVGIMWLVLFCTGMIMYKYNYYKPFKNMLSMDGIYGTAFYVQHIANDENWFVNDSSELVDYLENVEEVYGMYQLPPQQVNNKLTSAWAYDDYFIENYKPSIKEGVWLENKSNNEFVDAVVYNPNGKLHTGDVVEMKDRATGLSFKINIVGILSEDAQLIGFDKKLSIPPVVQESYVDPKVLIEASPYGIDIKWNLLEPEKTFIPDLFIFRNSDLSKLDIFKNSYNGEENFVGRVMTGVCSIVYKNNIAAEEKEIIKEKLAISDFLNRCTNKEKGEASVVYMYEEVKLLLPVGICVFVLLSIALISFVVLNFTSQLRSYAILTINGMKWKGSIIICLLQTLIIHFVSLGLFIISYVIVNSLNIVKLKYCTINGLFIIITLGIIIVDIVLSLIMPVVLINKKNPKTVLYNN